MYVVGRGQMKTHIQSGRFKKTSAARFTGAFKLHHEVKARIRWKA